MMKILDCFLAWSSVVVRLFFVGIFLFLILPHNFVLAEEAGVSVKPAMIERSMDPGSSMSFEVTVKNLNSTEQKFYLFTRNIIDIINGHVPVYAKSNDEVTGYELADWVELPVTEIDLMPNEQQTFSFTINVPENASPGSHFGGVFVSVDPPEIANSGAAVAYQVPSVLSIRISGDVIEEANIRQFSTARYLHGSQNVDFQIRIENTGNVVVKPTGPLEIYNMLGNKVGNLVFNPDQSAVLPKFIKSANSDETGIRQFEISWEGDSVGFGRYEAIASLVYGEVDGKKTISSTVTFWILPMNIILPALGVLFFLFLMIYIFVKLYIKRSLAHVHQGRRLIQRRRRGETPASFLILTITLTVTALFLIVLLILFA